MSKIIIAFEDIGIQIGFDENKYTKNEALLKIIERLQKEI